MQIVAVCDRPAYTDGARPEGGVQVKRRSIEKAAIPTHILVQFPTMEKFEDTLLAEPAALFDTDDSDAKERAVKAAELSPEADDAPLSEVKRWLQSWGKSDELPQPPWT